MDERKKTSCASELRMDATGAIDLDREVLLAVLPQDDTAPSKH